MLRSVWPARVLVLALLLSIATVAESQPAYLVKDFSSIPMDVGAGWHPRLFTTQGERGYFSAWDELGNDALWRTDGTPEGTVALFRVPDPAGQGTISAIVPIGDFVYFTAFTPDTGTELWVTDSSMAGAHLVVDLSPGEGSTPFGEMVVAGNELYFVVEDGSGNQGLWRTVGPDSAPIQLRASGSEPAGLAAASGMVFFSDWSAAAGNEPWVTDGSVAGTRLFADLSPGPGSSSPRHLGVVGDRLFVVTGDDNHWELWVSPVTPAQPERLAVVYSAYPSSVRKSWVLGTLFLLVAPNEDGAPSLYVSDGTVAGTKLIRTGGFYTLGETVSLGRVSVTVAESSLLRTDGTAEGTFIIPTGYLTSENGVKTLVASGGTAFYRTDSGVFSTEGGVADLRLLIPRALLEQSNFLGGTPSVVYLRAQNALWKAEPSSGSLMRLRAFGFPTGASTGTRDFVAVGSRLMYIVETGGMCQLWSTSSGEGAGALVREAKHIRHLGQDASGGHWFGAGSKGRADFYRSDGTWDGTVLASSILTPDEAWDPDISGVTVGNLIFVSMSVETYEFHVWALNGSTSEATFLRSFPRDPFYPPVSGWTAAGSIAFFVVGVGAEVGLWRSDGTASGTYRLFENGTIGWVTAGPATAGGGSCVFVVDRIGGSQRWGELWSSDGTVSGTKSFYQLPNFSAGRPNRLLVLDGLIYFVSPAAVGYSSRLYQTDGTAPGTREAIPGFDLAEDWLRAIFRLGGKLTFFAGLGSEQLVTTDGTAAGTQELWRGSWNSGYLVGSGWQVHSLTPAGLIFSAQPYWESGSVLMISDGTPAGTQELQGFPDGDHYPPSRLVQAGSTVYFMANSDDFGYELYALPLGCLEQVTGAAPVISDVGGSTLACGELGSARLRVSGPYPQYVWSTGETTPEITVSPATTTLVFVTGLDADGCPSKPAFHVVPVRAIPAAYVEPVSRAVCSGGSTSLRVYLLGEAPWQLLWSDGYVQEVAASPAQRDVSPLSSTTYSVVDVRDRHCFGTGTGSASVTVVAPGGFTAPSAACAHQSGLTAAALANDYYGPSYLWSIENGSITGSSTGRSVTFTSSNAGSLTLRLTATADGCSTTSEKVIPVILIPPVPALDSPPNGATDITEPLLTWNDLEADSFDVLLDTVNPPRVRIAVDLKAKRFAPFGWLSGQTYYWRVAKNTPCGPVYSEVRQFSTGNCPWNGSAPALISPLDGLTGQDRNLALSWSAVPGTGHYDLYLGDSPATLKRYRSFLPDTTAITPSLNPGTWYYWKIVAVPSCGSDSAQSSSVSSFQTSGVFPALSLVSPASFMQGTATRLAVLGSGLSAGDRVLVAAEDGPLESLMQGTQDGGRKDLWVPANTNQRAGRYDVWLESGGAERARLPLALSVTAFTDVPETHFAFLSTSRITAKGFLKFNEMPNTTFKPSLGVKRSEAAMSLAQTYRYLTDGTTVLPSALCTPQGSGSTDFIDVACWHQSWLAIHWLKEWGVTQGAGCPNGPCFLPNDPMDRAQMITFLLRLKFGPALGGYLESFGAIDPGCSTAWPSCTGWSDSGLQVATWPRREANLGFQTRLTSGCAGTAGNALTLCATSPVNRDQLAEFLARFTGLVLNP